MRISRAYTGARLVVGEEVSLDKSQSHYLMHVLRLKSGAALLLFNGRDAIDYHARLVLDGKKAIAHIGPVGDRDLPFYLSEIDTAHPTELLGIF